MQRVNKKDSSPQIPRGGKFPLSEGRGINRAARSGISNDFFQRRSSIMVDRVQLKRRSRLFRYTGCKRTGFQSGGRGVVGSLRHTLQESSNNIAAVPELRWPERRERADSPRSSVLPELPGTLNAPHHRLNFENFPRILDARRITINSRPRSDRRYGCGPFSVCSTGDFDGGGFPFWIRACVVLLQSDECRFAVDRKMRETKKYCDACNEYQFEVMNINYYQLLRMWIANLKNQ